ncbi:sulfite exporter TauE/SafE family protein [Enterocloster lavalensis]|uniref:sulfite exporter TauE/SafE family protein n=1 Tax=Enterocloster lavalensis TaxID=460384 RepID=UPI002A818524|nr:sulfite exporter TauE/SafE family protein [Enterocloster lavalensis]
MGFWMIVILANLIVGVLVGLTGVAGFLLPIVYTGPLGMGVPEGLALSFAAFIVSGALGAMNYKRAGNLDIPFGIRLSTGSLVGAVLGVKLNLVIPEGQVKILLYMVVLLSGVSILLRKDKAQTEGGGKAGYQITEHLPATLALGFVTGMICSLSGAGGPVLVMPLLVVLGVNVRTAVGIALFNSVFIGIPACIGYMTQCSALDLLPVLAAALLAHGVGVVFGSKNAVRINQIILKKGIAVFSILIAVWKLAF